MQFSSIWNYSFSVDFSVIEWRRFNCKRVFFIKHHHAFGMDYCNNVFKELCKRLLVLLLGGSFCSILKHKPIQFSCPVSMYTIFFFTIFPNTTGWLIDGCSRNIRPFCVYEMKLSTNTSNSYLHSQRITNSTIAHA